jgi:dimethylamine/trimethylamine dehydrogenase
MSGSERDDPFTLARIGDCEAPAIIAANVYSGHRYAREIDNPADIDVPMKNERVDIGRASINRAAHG